MLATDFNQGLRSELEEVAINGTVGLGSFYRVVLNQLKALALSQVDTEAERDAIVAHVIHAADAVVAPRFPWGWPFVRANLEAFLDAQIDNLPALLES